MEGAAMESTVGFTGPKASTDALFVAAEAVNNEGSKLYRQGSFEAAATSYSEALARLGKSAGYRDGNTSDECPRRRSKYYANRGRARVQLQDFEMAALDFRASVEEDPRNAKAFIWWGRCEEALGRWDEALKYYEAASVLLQPGTSLLRTALEGGRRARTNREADRKVAREEPMPEELVHRRQMLRLSFREPVPAECRLGEWFSLSLGLSNEFGLWRRSDFGRSKTPAATIPKDQVAGCGGGGGGAEDRPAPSMRGGLPTKVGKVVVVCRGRETQDEREAAAAPGRLRLVVEARDLEGFGGRNLAGRCSRGSWTEGAEAPGGSTALFGAPPRSKGDITASWGGHAARLPPSFDESCCVTVETDDSGGEGKGSAIGPEGKTTLRARFVLVTVAGSCADRPNGSGDGGNSFPVRDLGVSPPAQNRPHFVLLRVSAVEDDAMLLLGRWVVPVLSLPIVLIEARGHGQDPNTTVASAPAPAAPENWRARSAGQELRALSAKASEAGAVGCREAVIPLARAPASTNSSGSSRRRRQRPDWSCGDAAAPATSAASDGTFDKGDSFRHGTTPPLWNRARRSALDRASGGADNILDRDRNGDGDVGGGGVGPDEAVLLVAESPGQLGIGGKVWDSAFVLCDYLAQAPKYSAPGAAAIALADGDHALSKGAGTPVDSKNGAMTPHLQASVATRSREKTLPAGAGGTSTDIGVRFAANGEPLRRHETQGDESMAPSNVGLTSCGGGLVKGKRVLELGAGTGLVSICCALLGASAVVATDFEGVTELIKVNVELNFSKTSSQPSAPAEDDQPMSATEPVKTLASESSLHGRQGQPTESSSSATAVALGMMAVKEKLSGLVYCAPRSGASEANGRNGGERCDRDLTPPSERGEELLQRNQAPVIAVPLVWGERSAEVTSFDPEVVVMSDVIYDPAGYEPLLQTLLDIMRPGMIAIMAHRHRHPEDHIFFERLHNLFSVVEEKEIPGRDWARCSSERTPSPPRTQTGEPLEGVDVRVFRIYCPVPL